ncbi:dienelactone hydrolase family protein [Panacibacter ginsenosidivorans]|uniref:Dienelactone hydrolase family protein n=1 Tax=Panacibacter ginsenosidivorans TaxID=1813871 RepID=A0A5B8VBR8_9BACT|nr:dienelactone hydrolase family protein [Panacibacter ginsenosidivorans]QEC68381.1 dienelactone hydrolase family protein [Panacibacter ginsenosidivorans]
MKKLIVFLFGSISVTATYAQMNMNCCLPVNATEKYALNANDKDFVAAHLSPLPYTYVGPGADFTYKAADGTDAHGWMIKADKPTDYYLFVIHEWWGLNDYIKKQSEQMANDLGINVIALDLYDNQVATTPADAAKIMQTVKTERAMAIIHGAYNFVGANAKVFTIGWCFGGGWSLQTAIEGGKQVAGCIMYYGQPEENVNRLKTINCDIIGFFGNKDTHPSPAMVDGFVKTADAAGVKLMVNRYEATHAFANPSNPNYDKDATADAYTKVKDFIKARME